MKILVLLSLVFFELGCGVKGNPKPPLRPAELGRGRPSFKGALKGQDLMAPKALDEDEDELEKKKKEH